MIKPLIWKEWQEQRWKLALGCVLLMGYTAIGLKSRLLPDEVIIFFGSVFGAPLMSILVAMGLVAVERSDGTLDMLFALPIKSWKVFSVKTIAGALICVIPVLGSMIVALLVAAGRELNASDIVIPYLGGMAFGLVMFIWTVAFGIRQPSEARVALVSMAIFAGWALIIILSEALIKRPHDRWSLIITPFGLFESTLDGAYDLLPKVITVQLLLGICLVLWAAYRFSKLERTKI